MNIDEATIDLPNGFHDSYLLKVEADFSNRTCRTLFCIDISTPGNHERSFRKGELELSKLLYLVIEPPKYGVSPDDESDEMSIESDTSNFSTLVYSEIHPKPNLPQEHPVGSFQHVFYSGSHNSCIYVSAMNANFSWSEVKV